MRKLNLPNLFVLFVPALLFRTVVLGGVVLEAHQTSTELALAAPPGGAVIQLIRGKGYFNEPAVAVNAREPEQIVAAYQSPAGAAYSRDYGKTWKLAEGAAPADYKVSGDVSVTFDNQGRAILCYIAFDKLGTENYWARGATRNGIFVRRSLDGGKTWEKNAAAVIAQKTEPGIPFEDKPYIVADNTTSRFAGNLYVGWTEFTLTKSVILFSRSMDGGVTWSKPHEISTHEGLPRDDTGAVEGFTGAVGTDGTLYVAWADGSEIAFARSTDGGQSFSSSQAILKTAPSYFALADVFRANGFPQMGIDPRSNRLFVSWADYRNGDIDVFCSTSTDRGRRWSEAVRVNTDALHNGADQFFQWMAVDPVDGSANLVFYDRRADPDNRRCNFTLARSSNGGRTFLNYAWTSKPFDPEGGFIGDYSGIAAYAGRVYGIWGRNARADENTEAAKSGENTSKEGEEKSGSSGGSEARPRRIRRVQIVEIGVADFSSASGR
jgi:hypothetical protein